MSSWTFLSNHGHVILVLGINPELTYREMAEQVGITERAVQKIIADLVSDGFVEIIKEGRRNRYTINMKKHLKHQVEADCEVGELINLASKKRQA